MAKNGGGGGFDVLAKKDVVIALDVDEKDFVKGMRVAEQTAKSMSKAAVDLGAQLSNAVGPKTLSAFAQAQLQLEKFRESLKISTGVTDGLTQKLSNALDRMQGMGPVLDKVNPLFSEFTKIASGASTGLGGMENAVKGLVLEIGKSTGPIGTFVTQIGVATYDMVKAAVQLDSTIKNWKNRNDTAAPLSNFGTEGTYTPAGKNAEQFALNILGGQKEASVASQGINALVNSLNPNNRPGEDIGSFIDAVTGRRASGSNFAANVFRGAADAAAVRGPVKALGPAQPKAWGDFYDTLGMVTDRLKSFGNSVVASEGILHGTPDLMASFGLIGGADKTALQGDWLYQQEQANGNRPRSLLGSVGSGVSNLFDVKRREGAAFGRQTAKKNNEYFDTAGMDLAKDAFGGFADAIGASVSAVIDGSESFGKAMKRMAADSLKALSTQAVVKALWETAEGVAALAFPIDGGITAATHFKAAALYAGVAVVAGASAAGLGSGGGSAGSGYSSAPGGGYTRDHRSGGEGGNTNITIQVSGVLPADKAHLGTVIVDATRQAMKTGRASSGTTTVKYE